MVHLTFGLQLIYVPIRAMGHLVAAVTTEKFHKSQSKAEKMRCSSVYSLVKEVLVSVHQPDDG